MRFALPMLAALALLTAQGPPTLQAQDTVAVAEPNDTAITLPPEVSDSTAVSLPTEPPKGLGDFLVKYLPLLTAAAQTLLLSLFAKIWPAFAAQSNAAKYVAQFLVGIGFYYLIRAATGTSDGSLWTLAMSAASALIGMLTTGWAFGAGRVRALRGG